MAWSTTTCTGAGIGSKIIFCVLGLFFTFIGSQGLKQGWQSLQETKAMQEWAQIDCTIQTCSTEDDGEDFRLDLTYLYTVNGQKYTSDQYGKQRYLVRESIREIKAAETKLFPGKITTGYHNPDNPIEAVLDLPSYESAKTSFAMMFFFPAFGIFLSTAPWFLGKKKTITKTNQAGPKKFLIVFGSIFAIIGCFSIKPLIIDPALKIQRAKNWEAVPAVVVSSKVKSHKSDDGTTYSPYIAYSYEFDGYEYFGDQLTFTGGSGSDYEGKAAIVRQYPKGHEFQVYACPANPSESVINREASAGLLFGIIPLIFTIVGIGIITAGFRVGKGGKAKLKQDQAQKHAVTLKGSSRLGPAICITVFSVIWNGVVYLIYQSGDLLFLIIFGLVGLGIIGLVIKTYLSLFNPRPAVELAPGEIHPGTNVVLRWRIDGRVERLNDLGIELKCVKVTTVTSGHGDSKSARVVKTSLYECELFKSSSASSIPQGALQFIIPSNRPASRPGSSDGIEWKIVLSGEILRWPDMKQEFTFLVYPDA